MATDSQVFVARLFGRIPAKRCGCTTRAAQGCIWGGDETDACICKCHHENRRVRATPAGRGEG